MIFAKVINMNDDYLKWKDVELVEYEDKYFDYVYELYQDYNSRYLFTSNLNIISKKNVNSVLLLLTHKKIGFRILSSDVCKTRTETPGRSRKCQKGGYWV